MKLVVDRRSWIGLVLAVGAGVALAAALLGGFTMRAVVNMPGSYVTLWAAIAVAVLAAAGVIASARGGTST